MITCESCRRHIRESEATCPFCARPSSAKSTVKLLAGGLTAFVLTACYGSPAGIDTAPPDDTDVIDSDGDGHTADVDCNDADPAIHPDAVEICDDGVDNDCDTLIDDADPDCAP